MSMPIAGLQLHGIVYSMCYFFLAHHKSKTVREITEADMIRKASATCISSSSLDLKTDFLAAAAARTCVAHECDDGFFYICLHL